jgi:hypothetical protein
VAIQIDSNLSDMRWWTAPEDQAVLTMTQVARSLRSKQQDRVTMYLHFARLYYGFGLQGLDPNTYMDEPDPLDSEPLSDNVVRSCIKSALPRVCKSKPRPMFLTQAGNWSDRVKAHRLEQVINGDFYKASIYKVARTMVRDAAIFGTAAIRVFAKDGFPAYDRVFPWQLVLDGRDSYYGAPRCLYYWQYVDRRVLAAIYPELKEELMKAPTERDSSDPLDIYTFGDHDQLMVWHAWHLPSGKDSGDGLYLCGIGASTNGILLCKEQWEHDHFPFTFYKWDEPVIGFWGEGVAREIAGHQYEIGAVTRAVRMSLRTAVQRTYVPRGSQVMTSDIDDRMGTVIEYVGNQLPVTLSPEPIHTTFLTWLDNVKEGAYHMTGVSQMAAFSQKPPGIIAARALQQYEDVEDTRFLFAGEGWEQCIVDLAHQTVRVRKQIAEEEGTSKPLTAWDAKRRSWRTINWNDVELDTDAYHLQVYPVSTLPSTPAGKTDLVESWFQSGVIDPDERRMLLDLPDVEGYSDLHNAPHDYVWQQIETMLYDGKAQVPDPTVGPDLPIKIGRLAYIGAKRDGCPEERLELLRNYLDNCITLLKVSMPEPEAEPEVTALPPIAPQTPAPAEQPQTRAQTVS